MLVHKRYKCVCTVNNKAFQMSSSVYCYCDDLHLLWSSGLLISTHTYRATQWKTSILVVFEAWSSALPSPTLSIPHRIALFRNILLCSSLLSDLRIKRVWVVTAQQTHWRLWIWITRHHHQMKGTEREREGEIDWLICLRIFLSLYLSSEERRVGKECTSRLSP